MFPEINTETRTLTTNSDAFVNKQINITFAMSIRKGKK